MLKVAFYFDNTSIADRDCSVLDKGNPGIGGTEYLFFATPYELQKRYHNIISVILLTTKDMSLPKEMLCYAVGDINDAIAFCSNRNINIFVVRNLNGIQTKLPRNFNVVIWAHNFIDRKILNKYARNPNIAKIVNVSREQLDNYRDNKAFLKSCYIYNWMYLENNKEKHIPFAERNNEVTYIGSLIPSKGFHLLAKVWKEVIRNVPNAHLNVIGNGCVYGESKLGKYNIASESYEKQFISYLTSEGGIIPSVTFWGRLGSEKNDILARTKVGVPNPTGLTETFCLSAVEMGLYGAWLVTKHRGGYLDTIPPFAGTLFCNEDKLAQFIIAGLRKTDYDSESYLNYCMENFSLEKILPKWLDMFSNIAAGKTVQVDKTIINRDYNFKYLKEINRRIKSLLPFGYLLPTVEWYINVMNKIFHLKIEHHSY